MKTSSLLIKIARLLPKISWVCEIDWEEDTWIHLEISFWNPETQAPWIVIQKVSYTKGKFAWSDIVWEFWPKWALKAWLKKVNSEKFQKELKQKQIRKKELKQKQEEACFWYDHLQGEDSSWITCPSVQDDL